MVKKVYYPNPYANQPKPYIPLVDEKFSSKR